MSIKTENIQRIIRKDGIQPEESALWLQADGEGRGFHCTTCGSFLFYHRHRIIALVQDDMSQVFMAPPLAIQCQKCGHIYQAHIF